MGDNITAPPGHFARSGGETTWLLAHRDQSTAAMQNTPHALSGTMRRNALQFTSPSAAVPATQTGREYGSGAFLWHHSLKLATCHTAQIKTLASLLAVTMAATDYQHCSVTQAMLITTTTTRSQSIDHSLALAQSLQPYFTCIFAKNRKAMYLYGDFCYSEGVITHTHFIRCWCGFTGTIFVCSAFTNNHITLAPLLGKLSTPLIIGRQLLCKSWKQAQK